MERPFGHVVAHHDDAVVERRSARLRRGVERLGQVGELGHVPGVDDDLLRVAPRSLVPDRVDESPRVFRRLDYMGPATMAGRARARPPAWSARACGPGFA